MDKEPIVCIIDDDEAICDIVTRLVQVSGFSASSFSSGAAFLNSYSDDIRGCIVLDIWLPDMTGIELYEELLRRNCRLPVIIISGHADIPLSVQAIKKGALDFLEKPFQNSMLLTRVREAIERDRASWHDCQALDELRTRFESLTDRESEIVDLLVDGQQNKEIARVLNISRRTVETHRAHIMHKVQARTISKLIQDAMKLREGVKVS